MRTFEFALSTNIYPKHIALHLGLMVVADSDHVILEGQTKAVHDFCICHGLAFRHARDVHHTP